jgi:hypothetical protein
MTTYSPINAFQRNPDGTFNRNLAREDSVEVRRYPLSVDPPSSNRSYSHYANPDSQMMTGQVPPTEPDYFTKQAIPTRIQSTASAYKMHSKAELDKIYNLILKWHPNFKSLFFNYDGLGLATNALLAVASYFYKDRLSFNMYDLMCISEGKLLLENSIESDKICLSNGFYSSPNDLSLSNIYRKTYASEEEKLLVLQMGVETFKSIGTILGESFFDVYVKRNNKNMVKVNNVDIGIIHGNTSVGDTSNYNSQREDAFSGPISCKVTYYNHCIFDIVVVERSGLKQVVKTKSWNRKPMFVVRRTYVVGNESFKDLSEYFTYTPNDNLTDVMKVFKTVYTNTLKNLPHSLSVTVVIENSIDENQIKLNNGDVYFVTEDVLITDKPLMTAPNHPFNARAFNQDSFNNFTDSNGDIGVNFEIVDNQNRFGDRYLMLARKVYKLSPKSDYIRQDGLYITSMERDPLNEGKKKPIQSYFPLENLEENYGIFKTLEEAQTGGDIQSLRKETIISLEHNYRVELQNLKNISLDRERENNDLKHQIQQVQLKAESDNQVRKERMAAIEQENKEKDARRDQAERESKEAYAERERVRNEETARLVQTNKFLEADLERQRNMTKDFYEGKSYAMKNTSELIKWIPTMVGAVLGILGLVFMKTKSA